MGTEDNKLWPVVTSLVEPLLLALWLPSEATVHHCDALKQASSSNSSSLLIWTVKIVLLKYKLEMVYSKQTNIPIWFILFRGLPFVFSKTPVLTLVLKEM